MTQAARSIQSLTLRGLRWLSLPVTICLMVGFLGACTTPKIKKEATVTKNSPEASAAAEGNSIQLKAAIAEYKTYVQKESDQMVGKTKTFTDAVIAGDLEAAKQAYAPARTHYERMEPIAELFSDLDKSMDSRADDFEKKEADPGFTGFHRIEKALFQDKTTDGMKPIAQKLVQDTLDLQKRIATLEIEPKNMVGGAAELIEEVASKKVTGEEDRYSRTDLWDFRANLDGAEKIVDLLRPQLTKANPTLLAQIDTNFKKLGMGLEKYKSPNGGFVTYDNLTEADKKDLKTIIASHAEDLAKLRGVLGVE